MKIYSLLEDTVEPKKTRRHNDIFPIPTICCVKALLKRYCKSAGGMTQFSVGPTKVKLDRFSRESIIYIKYSSSGKEFTLLKGFLCVTILLGTLGVVSR